MRCHKPGDDCLGITTTELTTGEEEIASPSLTIENMDRHKGGTYICTADNGVGQPATSVVVLHVLCEYMQQKEGPMGWSECEGAAGCALDSVTG